MRIIHDYDTDVFTDPDGARLTLLVAPRQRDVVACDDVARKEAFAMQAEIKAAGMDVDKMLAEADPAKVKAATASAESSVSAKVRRFRLDALAVSLGIGTEAFGGHEVAKQYDSMDPASVAWIDAQVASVWESAIPSEADTRGPAADAAAPEAAAIVAAE